MINLPEVSGRFKIRKYIKLVQLSLG